MNLSLIKAPEFQPVPDSMNIRLATLVFTVFYFFRWLYEPMTPAEWAAQIGAYLVFLVLYFLAFRLTAWIVPIGFAMLALSVAIAPQNHGANVFAIFAASCFGYTLPVKPAAFYLILTVALMAVATWLMNLSVIGYLVVGASFSLAIGFIGVFTRQQYVHLYHRQQSQAEISRLAKIAERERIGQDLHDLLGHSLTAIALQSELCLKRWEARDWDALQSDLTKVRDTAKQSLREVRHAVTGFKTHSLAQELASQRDFLRAMGVELHYHLPTALIPPQWESDLLMIVREALTNIMRHAGASQCWLDCSLDDSGLALRIRDDGRGLTPAALQRQGSGLAGIRRRVQARGGECEFACDPGLHLKIHLPWGAQNAPQPA